MLSFKQLQDIVENTKFYGCGDEAYENWSLLCHLCQQMATYDLSRAQVIVKWIVKDAAFSKKWALKEYGELDENDCEMGVWE